MSGTSCLCGYNMARSNHKKAFVLMTNSFRPPIKDLFEVTDDFINKHI